MKPDFKKNYYVDLFTWKDLSELINMKPLMDTKRVQVLSPASFTWKNDPWTTNNNTWPPTLLREALEKYLCCFIEMSRCNKKLNDFAAELEKKFNQQVDAHIYSCRNLEIDHPFGIHFDYSDNVIVQCEGTTNFKVWSEIDDHDQHQSNLKIDEEPIIDVEMNPGDAIWIPRYYPHLATSKSIRLSVSFPLTYSESKVFQDRNWIEL